MKTLSGNWHLLMLFWLPIMCPDSASAASDLGWLEGCWQSPDKSSLEVWMSHQSHSLSGFSVVVAENKVVFYEVLSIFPKSDGSRVYTATPLGQETTSFVSIESSDNRVVFRNPDHDYPQQITYQRKGNQLLAIISLEGGGNPKSFNKIRCE